MNQFVVKNLLVLGASGAVPTIHAVCSGAHVAVMVLQRHHDVACSGMFMSVGRVVVREDGERAESGAPLL